MPKTKKYIVTTEVESAEKKGDFVIKIYSYSEKKSDEHTDPVATIHDFDELIAFLENEGNEND